MGISAEENGAALAFPTRTTEDTHGDAGLTKREHFAAMAMQGNLASLGWADLENHVIAAASVKQADALLEALAEQGGRAL